MTPTPEQRDQLFKDFARALFKHGKIATKDVYCKPC